MYTKRVLSLEASAGWVQAAERSSPSACRQLRERPAMIGDFAADDFHRFVAVEPVRILPSTVLPGGLALGVTFVMEAVYTMGE